MPNIAQTVAIYRGTTPPPISSSQVLWLSQSHKNMRPSMGVADRQPIFGNTSTGGTDSQECSPYWNSTLNRWEALVNGAGSSAGNQCFAYANDFLGPWTIQTPTFFGNGHNGEAGNVQQLSIYQEGGVNYCTYLTSGNSPTLRLAYFTPPTTVGTLPTMTVVGNFLSSYSGSGFGTVWITAPVNGVYYMFAENGHTVLYSSTTAAASWVNGSFTVVNQGLDGSFCINLVERYIHNFGRPCVIYENGTWIMYAHMTGSTTGPGFNGVWRWFCTDPYGVPPTNWVPDVLNPVVRMSTPFEIDQCPDFRTVKGPDDRWYCNWTGAANRNSTMFNIIASVMNEPLMANDGNTWHPIIQNPDFNALQVGFFEVDALSGNTTATHRNEMWGDALTHAGMVITLPYASCRETFKIGNNAVNGTNPIILQPQSIDTLNGGNPITSMTAVSTTVTVTTLRPHNLATTDYVTITGCTPTAYNINGTLVTGVPTTTTFTYTASSSPATNTVLGVWERGPVPGETFKYKCWAPGHWIRDS